MASINKPTFNDLKNSVFRKECSNNNVERIKDLIERDNESKLDLRRGFLMACSNGSLSVVKYFIETKNIKEKLDLNGEYGEMPGNFFSNRALIQSYENSQLEVVNYLLFDVKIDIREQTREALKSNGKQELLNIIEKRDIFDEMNSQNNNENKDVKKSKI